MRIRTVVSLLGGLFVTTALHACGDDTTPVVNSTAPSGSPSGGGDGGSGGGGGSCSPLGTFCDPVVDDCCAGQCADIGLAEPVCVSAGGFCVAAGGPCATALDCCSLACAAGFCQESGGCISQGQGCVADADCCSDACVGGACGPGGGGCIDGGQPCTDNHNCCSGTCANGACEGSGQVCLATGEDCSTDSQCCSSICDQDTSTCAKLPYCRPTGEACSSASQCCSLVCEAGYCAKLTWCRPAFEPCTGDDMECCSGRCTSDPYGFLRCLPIGGCRPSGPVLTSKGEVNLYGEVCAGSCDCCTEVCEADSKGVERCKKLGDPTCGAPDQVQLPPGEICETDCQCVTGVCAEPRPPDAGGQFPKRCLGQVPDPGGGQCKKEGEQCVDPADCCNGLCLPSDTLCGFECFDGGGGSGGGGAGGGSGSGGAGGTCPGVEPGGACTTSSDCCFNLPCIPDGKGGLICDVPPPN